MIVWMKLWGKCADSFTVYYDQGDKPKNILLFLVVFNIRVFSFIVQKKLLMMLKIHLKTVMKRNFYHVNLYIDSTGKVSNCSNSNLKGPLVLLRSMLVQIILFFFFIEYVLFTILTQCHFNTSRTTTQVPQTCTLEYVRNVLSSVFSNIIRKWNRCNQKLWNSFKLGFT